MLLHCIFTNLTISLFLKPYLKIYFVVDRSSENGSGPDRSSWLLRSSPCWKYFAEYFPIVLHKTHELDPAFDMNEEEWEEAVDDDDNNSNKKENANGIDKNKVLKGQQETNDPTDDDLTTATTTQMQESNKKNMHKRKAKGKEDFSKQQSHFHKATQADKSSSSEETIVFSTTEHASSDDFEEEGTIIQSSTIFERPIKERGIFGIRTFFKDVCAWIWNTFSGKSSVKYNKRTGKQYIFGYHPHGIIGMGAIGAVATEGK